MQRAKQIVWQRSFPGNHRTRIAIGFALLVTEHQESALILLSRGYVRSAAALVRPTVEGSYRGLWVNRAATKDEIRKFVEKDKVNLTFQELAFRIDTAYGTGGFFQGVASNVWDLLNSLTHGGKLQIARTYLEPDVLASFSPREFRAVAGQTTTIALLFLAFFLREHNYVEDSGRVRALIDTYGDPEVDATPSLG